VQQVLGLLLNILRIAGRQDDRIGTCCFRERRDGIDFVL
jgi:hypothetical protein